MKVLVVFAFFVLGCSLAAARSVTKCELKQQLIVAFSSLPENVTINGMSDESFLAKMVCHVEQLSNFNTSVVTRLSRELIQQHLEDSSESRSESEEDDGGQSSNSRRHNRGKGRKSNEDDLDHTLYGLFQLPVGLVCSSGTKTSPNMCGISCDKLTDDDISDDIDCVMKLIKELVTKGFMAQNSRELWKVVKQLIDDRCKNLNQYFSEC